MAQRHVQTGAKVVASTPAPADLLDVTDAARHLGTPVRFIRRLVAERRIRFYKIGRYVRIDSSDLDHFVQDGRIDPSGGPRR